MTANELNTEETNHMTKKHTIHIHDNYNMVETLEMTAEEIAYRMMESDGGDSEFWTPALGCPGIEVDDDGYVDAIELSVDDFHKMIDYLANLDDDNNA